MSIKRMHKELVDQAHAYHGVTHQRMRELYRLEAPKPSILAAELEAWNASVALWALRGNLGLLDQARRMVEMVTRQIKALELQA